MRSGAARTASSKPLLASLLPCLCGRLGSATQRSEPKTWRGAVLAYQRPNNATGEGAW